MGRDRYLRKLSGEPPKLVKSEIQRKGVGLRAQIHKDTYTPDRHARGRCLTQLVILSHEPSLEGVKCLNQVSPFL